MKELIACSSVGAVKQQMISQVKEEVQYLEKYHRRRYFKRRWYYQILNTINEGWRLRKLIAQERPIVQLFNIHYDFYDILCSLNENSWNRKCNGFFYALPVSLNCLVMSSFIRRETADEENLR